MSSIGDEIDAVVTRWVPLLPADSALDRYLRKWEEKIRPHSPDPESDVASYRASIQRHCRRMDDFLEASEDVFQCLALGEVQSGKTGHLTASICWAASSAIHLVVVMSGTKLSLMNQTRKRLAKEMPSGVVSTNIVQPNYTDQSRLALVRELQPLVQARMRDSSGTLPMLVTPKTSKRMDQLVEVVRALRSSLPDHAALNILVIDDEGDEASADTTASRRGRAPARGRFANRADVRRAVHSCIADLRREASGKLIYLSYTATPQALLLGELDGILQPQYCTVVPSGAAYLGLQDATSDPETLRTVPIAGAQALATPQDDIYYALEVAFAEFLVQSWLHYSHRRFFHSGLEGVPECTMDGVQMLVHPSADQGPHRQYQQYLEQLREDWLRALLDPARSDQLLHEFLRPAFVRVLDRYPADLRRSHGVTGAQVHDFYQFVLEVLSDENELQIWEINSREFGRRNRTQEGRESLPSEDSEWQGPRAMVLVGGNLLGRGITIPHLVTSFFLRDPQQPNFDTTAQQMRFCGYRKSFERSISIFAPQTLLDVYDDIANSDAPFRNRALTWDLESTDLYANPPAARFVVRSGSRLNMTRSNVISGDVGGIDTTDANQSGLFATRHVGSISRFGSNAQVLLDRFGSRVPSDQHASREGWHVNSYSVGSSEIRELLKEWSIVDEDKEGPGLLWDLLQWPDTHGGYANEPCFVLVDSPLLVNGNPSALWRTMIQSQGQGWMRRTVGLPHSYKQSVDRINEDPTGLEDGIRIPTVVGGSERSAREPFRDAIVLHCRAYGLRRQETSPPIAYGISMIGWVPDDATVFSLNMEAAGLFDA